MSTAVPAAATRPEGWRRWIGDAEFPAESGRYRLYISLACPWASRCFMGLCMKGLQDAIPVTIVSPVWRRTRPEDPADTHSGWPFVTSEEFPRCSLDPNGCKSARDLYEKAGDTMKKYSVPILWDSKNNTIVNNESSEILRMIDSQFDAFAKHPKVHFCPEHMKKQIDEINEWVYNLINYAVYRAGLAESQKNYDDAIRDLYNGLDRVEEILSKQRFLLGSRFTEADLRLFVSLVRFDDVYTSHFKCNKKRVSDYPNLINYTRDIYQMEGVAQTVDMNHIKNFYFRSQLKINPSGIVAAGPDVDFSLPHDRSRFPMTTMED